MISGVTFINKQKFLAELSKLLTFMYEEDRQRALELYSRMFDEAEDERALIQSLLSPTKQAVIVARAYNSNLGRLAINTEHKAAPEDRDENGVPDYIQAIEKVRDEAFAAQPRPAAPAAAEETESEEETEFVDENQMTLFAAEETGSEEEPDEPEAPAAEEAAEPAEEAGTEEPEAEAGPEAEAQEESESAEEAGPEAESEEEPAAEPAEEPGRAAEEEDIRYFTLPREGETDAASNEGDEDLSRTPFNIETSALKKPQRKPKVFALILYILFAIPLTLAAIVLLLIPALLCLALSVAAIICGVVVVSTAFEGSVVLFADIMVLLGGALVLFALGLLFLWASIWFVGGAIVGVVHGVASLCDKWCYKEVQV